MKFPPWWGYGYFLELHNVNYGSPEKTLFRSLECAVNPNINSEYATVIIFIQNKYPVAIDCTDIEWV